MWDARIIKVEEEPYIMSMAWRWDDNPIVETDTMQFDPDDSGLVSTLRSLMDSADIVVAHNAKKFDNRVANARFLHWGMAPPSPYKTVDTLLVARRYFKMPTYNLNDLCSRLGLGEKPKTTHADLWHRCLGGDPEAWDKMVEYNKNDVELLFSLYEKLLPYISDHPNVNLYSESDGCPKCGSKRMHYRGYAYTGVSTFRRLQCQECGGWARERVSEPRRVKHVNAR